MHLFGKSILTNIKHRLQMQHLCEAKNCLFNTIQFWKQVYSYLSILNLYKEKSYGVYHTDTMMHFKR